MDRSREGHPHGARRFRVTPNQDGDTDPVSQHRASRVKTYKRFNHIERERRKNLATWLVTTGMRFSEATALTAADVDAEARTCRINKASKYSGDYRPEIGPPKTKKSIRTISLPQAALEVVDLTTPALLFTWVS